ncbi:predicted protein [Nematostella vectensis]|uniref:Uncharacterized protein n=2 Tax=Nematostella vectensis TaxID=45351 RepID=A7SI95_NEMVE|nr:predicted protein [Nematostella vectensis]|eukprot:XP_001628598.1 predicted protein [Nematostella vectensis]
MYSPELDPTIKVVFVGDKNVGKTSFLYAATTHNFPTGFIASIFDGYSKTMEIDGKRYTVLLCDTPGTMHPRIPPQHWFQYASVFLLCFDIANRESFANIESTWLPHVNLETSDVPKVLVGNKMELRCSQQE